LETFINYSRNKKSYMISYDYEKGNIDDFFSLDWNNFKKEVLITYEQDPENIYKTITKMIGSRTIKRSGNPSINELITLLGEELVPSFLIKEQEVELKKHYEFIKEEEKLARMLEVFKPTYELIHDYAKKTGLESLTTSMIQEKQRLEKSIKGINVEGKDLENESKNVYENIREYIEDSSIPQKNKTEVNNIITNLEDKQLNDIINTNSANDTDNIIRNYAIKEHQYRIITRYVNYLKITDDEKGDFYAQFAKAILSNKDVKKAPELPDELRDLIKQHVLTRSEYSVNVKPIDIELFDLKTKEELKDLIAETWFKNLYQKQEFDNIKIDVKRILNEKKVMYETGFFTEKEENIQESIIDGFSSVISDMRIKMSSEEDLDGRLMNHLDEIGLEEDIKIKFEQAFNKGNGDFTNLIKEYLFKDDAYLPHINAIKNMGFDEPTMNKMINLAAEKVKSSFYNEPKQLSLKIEVEIPDQQLKIINEIYGHIEQIISVSIKDNIINFSDEFKYKRLTDYLNKLDLEENVKKLFNAEIIKKRIGNEKNVLLTHIQDYILTRKEYSAYNEIINSYQFDEEDKEEIKKFMARVWLENIFEEQTDDSIKKGLEEILYKGSHVLYKGRPITEQTNDKRKQLILQIKGILGYFQVDYTKRISSLGLSSTSHPNIIIKHLLNEIDIEEDIRKKFKEGLLKKKPAKELTTLVKEYLLTRYEYEERDPLLDIIKRINLDNEKIIDLYTNNFYNTLFNKPNNEIDNEIEKILTENMIQLLNLDNKGDTNNFLNKLPHIFSTNKYNEIQERMNKILSKMKPSKQDKEKIKDKILALKDIYQNKTKLKQDIKEGLTIMMNRYKSLINNRDNPNQKLMNHLKEIGLEEEIGKSDPKTLIKEHIIKGNKHSSYINIIEDLNLGNETNNEIFGLCAKSLFNIINNKDKSEINIHIERILSDDDNPVGYGNEDRVNGDKKRLFIDLTKEKQVEIINILSNNLNKNMREFSLQNPEVKVIEGIKSIKKVIDHTNKIDKLRQQHRSNLIMVKSLEDRLKNKIKEEEKINQGFDLYEGLSKSKKNPTGDSKKIIKKIIAEWDKINNTINKTKIDKYYLNSSEYKKIADKIGIDGLLTNRCTVIISQGTGREKFEEYEEGIMKDYLIEYCEDHGLPNQIIGKIKTSTLEEIPELLENHADNVELINSYKPTKKLKSIINVHNYYQEKNDQELKQWGYDIKPIVYSRMKKELIFGKKSLPLIDIPAIIKHEKMIEHLWYELNNNSYEIKKLPNKELMKKELNKIDGDSNIKDRLENLLGSGEGDYITLLKLLLIKWHERQTPRFATN